MADTIAVTPGSGANVLVDDLTTVNGGAAPASTSVQRVKVGFGADSDFNDVSSSSKLPVDTGLTQPLTDTQLRASAVSIQATELTNIDANFGAKADASASSDTGTFSLIALVKRLLSKIPELGNAAPSGSLPVNLSDDLTVGAAASIAVVNTNLLTGNVSDWYDAANFHSASIQIIGGSGISAGAIIFEQTNDTTNAAAGNVWAIEEDTSITATPQIAAITIAANSVRMFRAPVTARYVRVRVSTAFVGGNVRAVAVFSQMPYSRMVQTIAQSIAGNLNATIASPTLAAGTNAVGDVGIQYRENATGAASKTHVVSAASTNATIVKASAGRLIGYDFSNTTASWKYVKLHNQATSPTAGSGVVQTIGIPPNGKAQLSYTGGIAFSTGIGMTITGAAADADATAVAANDVVGDIIYA